MYPADFYGRPQGLPESERHALTYERLRRLSAAVHDDVPLLQRRETLFPLLEWAAIADPSLFYAFFLHHCTTVGAILEFGAGRDDLTPLLGELNSLTVTGALLMTELGHGNSNAAVRTRAVYDRETEEFVLHTPGADAVKYPPSVACAGIARVGIVTAALHVDGRECGNFCFVVPLRDADGPLPGVRVEPVPSPPALPLDWAAVSFDQVRVPYRNWLRDQASIGEDGTFTDVLPDPTMRSRQASRLIRYVWEGAAAGLSAVTRAAASTALRFAHIRQTNGTYAGAFAPLQPVIAYRNQQRALFGALASAYVSTLAVRTITTPEPPGRDAGAIRTIMTLKAAIDQIAERVTATTRGATGVLGFSPQNRFLDYEALAQSFNAAGLSTQVLYLNIAWTLALGLGYQAPEASGRLDDESGLLDPAAWATLAAARESRLHQQLTTELDKARAEGLSEFEVWNDRFGLAERTAEAHGFRLLAEIVRDVVAATPDPETRHVLSRLVALHFLAAVEERGGWFVAEGLVTPAVLRRIPALLDELCAELAPHAAALAEALDVPADLVGAPITEPGYVSAFTAVPAAGTH
ncbi:acyl-CoA dehydrogenase [Micromonospora sp. DT233]|uniref:acyl-CoA dehydrogenase n=1 Tax=Micromonospora sp. DT233 TaxID=3393432 RepID=UPI003CE9A088